MKRVCWIACILLTVMFAGCANPGSIMPNTSADELVKTLGKPTDTRRNPQGGESWDYAYGPEGFDTWRYVIDNNRTVRSVEQLITPERLSKVVPGETNEAGLIELLGRPAMITRHSNEISWSWRADLSPNKGHFFVQLGNDGIARSKGVMFEPTMDGGIAP